MEDPEATPSPSAPPLSSTSSSSDYPIHHHRRNSLPHPPSVSHHPHPHQSSRHLSTQLPHHPQYHHTLPTALRRSRSTTSETLSSQGRGLGQQIRDQQVTAMQSAYPISRAAHGSYQSSTSSLGRARPEESQHRIHGRSHSSKQHVHGTGVAAQFCPPQGHSTAPPPLPPRTRGINPRSDPVTPSYQKVTEWDLSGGEQGSLSCDGYVQEYSVVQETASEHSLSDSTQFSERSEPIHNRPR